MIDNLLGLKETSRDDITAILDDAVKLKNDVLKQDIKKSNILSGKSIITLFFENSTRTRVSFELLPQIFQREEAVLPRAKL